LKHYHKIKHDLSRNKRRGLIQFLRGGQLNSGREPPISSSQSKSPWLSMWECYLKQTSCTGLL